MSSEAISSRARYKSLSVMKPPMNAEPLRKFIGIATILIYFNVGYCVTIIGPTLLDLIQQVSGGTGSTINHNVFGCSTFPPVLLVLIRSPCHLSHPVLYLVALYAEYMNKTYII